VADDAAVLLRHAGQEAGDVDQRDQRDVVDVAGADEPRGLVGGVDVQHAGHHRGLVGDDAHGEPAEVCEPADEVRRELPHVLQEHAVVHQARDDLVHVVGGARILRDDPVQRLVVDHGAVERPRRRGLHVVLRQVGQQRLDDADRLPFIGRRELHVAGDGRVRARAAEVLLADDLAGGGADHLGAGDEHVRRVLDHDHEVGQRRRVGGTAGAGPGDDRDLRHHARKQRVVVEDPAVARERVHAFLDARAAAVVEADHGDAALEGGGQHLNDLGGVALAHGASAYGEILRESENGPAHDLALAGDDAVGRVLAPGQVGAAVADPQAELDERVLVEEQAQPLPGRQFPLLVLPRDSLRSAPCLQVGPASVEILETPLERHALSPWWLPAPGPSRPQGLVLVGGPVGRLRQR